MGMAADAGCRIRDQVLWRGWIGGAKGMRLPGQALPAWTPADFNAAEDGSAQFAARIPFTMEVCRDPASCILHRLLDPQNSPYNDFFPAHHL